MKGPFTELELKTIKAFAALGGRSGRGKSKRRGDSEYYRKLVGKRKRGKK
jgi:hypothetical protein